jgi:hypothetical protein
VNAGKIKGVARPERRFVSRLPTLDYLLAPRRGCIGAPCPPGAEKNGERAPRFIHFLTDFKDFSTVQLVPHRRHFLVLTLGFLLPLGCGPIVYVKDASPRAAAALNQAKSDQADRMAPYEYTKASLYYDKAREEAGRAYYQNAVDWGRRSQDCSRRASALARAAQVKPSEDAPRPNQFCGEL